MVAAALSSASTLCMRSFTSSPSTSASTRSTTARLQQFTRCCKLIREHHCFKLARRIREADKGEFVALFGTTLLLHGDSASQARGGCTFDQGFFAEAGIAFHPKTVERFGIFIQRMAGEIKTHRIKFVTQLFHGQPCVTARQDDFISTAAIDTAEHIVLPCGGLTGVAARNAND